MGFACSMSWAPFSLCCFVFFFLFFSMKRMRKEATRNAEMCHGKDQRADPIWSIVSEHVSVSAWVSGIVRFPWVFL